MRHFKKKTLYLHKCGIVHRDLKPSNICFSPETQEVKIIDFSLARESGLDNGDRTWYVQTRQYRAPELLLNSLRNTPKIDVWALGCIFYELMVYSSRIAETEGRVYLFYQDKNGPHYLLQQLNLQCRLRGTPHDFIRFMQNCDQPRFDHVNFAMQYTFDRDIQNNQYIPYPKPNLMEFVRPQMVQKFRYGHNIEQSQAMNMFLNDADSVDFLDFLLKMDPVDRPDAETCLRHAYLKPVAEQLDEFTGGIDGNLALAKDFLYTSDKKYKSFRTQIFENIDRIQIEFREKGYDMSE